MKMKIEGNKSVDWFLDLTVGDNATLPFQQINPAQIDCRFEAMDYRIKALKGSFAKAGANIFRIKSEGNEMLLNFSGGN